VSIRWILPLIWVHLDDLVKTLPTKSLPARKDYLLAQKLASVSEIFNYGTVVDIGSNKPFSVALASSVF
jgi:hypothetical protein